MIFPWQKRHTPSDKEEALAAKIEAQIKQKQAQEQYDRARELSRQLTEINERNHFTDAIRRAMGGPA